MNATNVTKMLYKRLRRCHRMSTRFFKTLIINIFPGKRDFIAYPDKKKVEWQNKVVLFYFILLYMTGVCIAVFGDVEPSGIFYKVANIIQGCCIVAILLLYLKKIINIRYAITLIFSICTVEIIVELIHQALYDGSRGELGILINMLILACIACASTLLYVKRLSLYISLLSVAAYNLCAYLTGSDVLWEYFHLIVLSFLCITFLGTHLARTFQLLLTENRVYKEKREQFLDYMQLTKEQWHELMEALRVTGKRVDIEQTESILMLMEERLQERLTYKAKEMIKQEQDYTAVILQQCPSLTELELKIANYIIKGLSSSEIASTLDTTTSTVTTTRSRIRTKCRLSRDVNLQCYLRRLTDNAQEEAE